jgi:ribosomal protein S27E
MIVAILPPTLSSSVDSDEPSSGFDIGTLALIGALAGGIGLVFVGVRSRKPLSTRSTSQKTTASPVRAAQPVIEIIVPAAPDFFLIRCVVCGLPTLRVESGAKLVQCTHCHTILRSQRGKKWLLRVNGNYNEQFYARYNDKVLSEAELRQLESETIP